MVATFVVEDGSGLATANSYVSVADADTYNENYHADAVWIAAPIATKELSLRKATQYLDATYGILWVGTQKTKEQALDWPRIGAEDSNGYSIDSNIVPSQVADATVEAAIRDINGTVLTPDTTASIKKEKAVVGPITSEIEYVGGKTATVHFTIIDDLLDGITIGGGVNTPLFRG